MLSGPCRYAALVLLSLIAASASAQPDSGQSMRPEQTEIWTPVPAAVTWGDAGSARAPSDAIVLFDGSNLDEWVNTRDGSPASWDVAAGVLTVNKSAGNIETRRRFANFQMHLEWKIPENVTGSGQSRGNSGLFLASTGPGDRGYELQILDSWDNQTYVNGMAGSVYKQSVPLVYAGRPPGQWQSYDVIWNAPRFADDGELTAPARITVFYNGVLVQDDFELAGETVFVGEPRYVRHGDSPIKLQAHGDPSPPISFRNIWVRPIP